MIKTQVLYGYFKDIMGKPSEHVSLNTFIDNMNYFFAENYTPEEYDEIVVMDGDSKIIGFNVEDRLIPGTRLYNMIYKG